MKLVKRLSTITARYLYILFFMILCFSIAYAALFMINRIQYINDDIKRNEAALMHDVDRTAHLAQAIEIYQLWYFVDFSNLAIHAFKNDTVNFDKFARKSLIYEAIAAMNPKGEYIYTSNKIITDSVKFEKPSGIAIKSDIGFSQGTLKTYRVLSYPVLNDSGKVVAHLVVFLNLNMLLDMKDLYIANADGRILNDSHINGIDIGSKNLSFLYPEGWQKMQESDEGQFIADNALFTYHAITPASKIADFPIETKKTYFLTVMPINEDDSPYHIDGFRAFLKYTNFTHRLGYWIMGYCWIVFMCVVLYFIIVNRIKENLLSNTCQLTGAYNRRKGYIILDQLIKEYNLTAGNVLARLILLLVHLRRPPTSLHICLVDIDNLKTTNDKLGHQCGDELIASTIHIIRSRIRRNEVIIRIGGDEFLVIFINRKLSDIDRIWQNISEDFDKRNKSGKYRYNIRVSKGVIEYKRGLDVEQCVVEADKLMYKEKKGHKVNLYFD